MDQSLGWQKAVEELAGNNQEMHTQYREILRWFPTVQMMRNHAHGLVKVMTTSEKQRAFPRGFTILLATILLWAMREARGSSDPRQRARWWMYHSSTTTPAGEDPTRVAYRAKHEVEELVVLFDDASDVQLLAPVLDAVDVGNMP
ncbi:hypothetical protein ZWY2020_030253 [Hordeum vulgare]|nr:hypothetical protein ZWY2020_030253 [Hordeum vulgare]